MIVVRLVVLVPKIARTHTIEKTWFSGSVFLLPPVVLRASTSDAEAPVGIHHKSHHANRKCTFAITMVSTTQAQAHRCSICIVFVFRACTMAARVS